MSIKTYQKKPVQVQAIQYFGITAEILEFVKDSAVEKKGKLFLETLEGRMRVSHGDYIIKGIKDEVYPCKPDIFEGCYELCGN